MKKTFIYKIIFSGLMLCMGAIAFANKVEVVNVEAQQSADKTWRFDVTLKHQDEGWDHYANEWQIIGLDNKIFATRTLYHPHVHEQPFTRSLSGVKIPENVKVVRIIAKDTVHGLSNKAGELNLQSKIFKPVELTLKKPEKAARD